MLQTEAVPVSNLLVTENIKSLPEIQSFPSTADVKLAFQYPGTKTTKSQVHDGEFVDEKKKLSKQNNDIKNNNNNNKQPERKPLQQIKLPSLNSRASSPVSDTTNQAATTNSSGISTPPLTPHLFNISSRNQSFSSFSTNTNLSDPLLDHSHLKPGQNASLLSYNKTITMYRENVKKTNNMDVQCDFAIFLVEVAKQFSDNGEEEKVGYVQEAEKLLKQVAVRGHSESQYYLANMYAAGLLTNGKADFEKAFPLFVQSAKHHHPDAAYRTAKCYEEGLGTRRDKGKAVQFYRKAATLNHPGSMYRLGLAEMKGELGLSRNIRDGHKWLKRSAEAATPQYPHALHELGLLHEKGVEPVIFSDLKYAVSLYHDAASLGYAPSAYRLGQCYEFGKLECTPDPALSITYYSIAAEQNHPDACFALTAWYLVGVPNSLEPSDEQAYAWAMRAAQGGLPRAEYAIGYFLEMGIGAEKNDAEAMQWYQKAAQHGEKRALQRLGHEPIVDMQYQKRQKKPAVSTVSLSSTSSPLATPKPEKTAKKIISSTNKATPISSSSLSSSSSPPSSSPVSSSAAAASSSSSSSSLPDKRRPKYNESVKKNRLSFMSTTTSSGQSSFIRRATSFLRRSSSSQK